MSADGPPPRGTLAFAQRLQQSGRYAEAEAAFAAHIAAHPADADALATAGAAAFRAGNARLAVNRFERLAALKPADAGARCALGEALTRVGRAPDAVFHLRRAVQLDPAHALAHCHLGVALDRTGDRVASVAAFERALALDPQFADAAAHLGRVFNRRGETARAREAFGRALDIAPAHVAARAGMALSDAIDGDLDGARARLEAMSGESPHEALYWGTLGRLRTWAGAFAPAEAAYRQALARDADDQDARDGVATSLLARGNYDDGFRIYEERPEGRYGSARRFSNLPVWSGAKLRGGLLVLCEDRMSDVVQFARFLPDAKARVRELVLVADGYWAPLVPLLATSAGCDRILDDGGLVERLDARPIARVTLPSLGHLLEVAPETLPRRMPYLSAPADRIAQWRAKIAALPSPRVGVAWAARADRGTLSRHKSVPPTQFASLISVPRVSFVSLQVGAMADRAPFGALADRIVDFSAAIRDFGDTAAIIDALDVVVSVDTSVAHVAGAMGKPVWLLDRFHTSWRWQLDDKRSPWYPSLRIFRQRRFLDWSDPLAGAEAALRRLVADETAAP